MPTKDVFFAVVMIDSAPLFPRFSVINPHNSQDEVFCVVYIVQSKQAQLKMRLGRSRCNNIPTLNCQTERISTTKVIDNISIIDVSSNFYKDKIFHINDIRILGTTLRCV